MAFNSNQLLFKTEQLLEIIPIPRDFLYKLQREFIAKGGSPEDMGKVSFVGNRKNYWNAPKFLKWLIENKVISSAKYDYEVEDKKISENALLIINKKMQDNT